MQFFELIERVGIQLHLPDLIPNPNGVCAIRVDGMVITFRHEPAMCAFTLSTRVGRVDLGDASTLASLAAADLGGPTLEWNLAGEVTLRQRFFLPALEFRLFFRALQRFVDQAEAWGRRLS